VDTASKGRLEAVRSKLEAIVRDLPPTSDLARKVWEFISAINYRDIILIQSSQRALFEAITQVVQELIQDELAASEQLKTGLQDLWRDQVQGVVFEDWMS
jgi:hypothetical protein